MNFYSQGFNGLSEEAKILVEKHGFPISFHDIMTIYADGHVHWHGTHNTKSGIELFKIIHDSADMFFEQKINELAEKKVQELQNEIVRLRYENAKAHAELNAIRGIVNNEKRKYEEEIWNRKRTRFN